MFDTVADELIADFADESRVMRLHRPCRGHARDTLDLVIRNGLHDNI